MHGGTCISGGPAETWGPPARPDGLSLWTSIELSSSSSLAVQKAKLQPEAIRILAEQSEEKHLSGALTCM